MDVTLRLCRLCILWRACDIQVASNCSRTHLCTAESGGGSRNSREHCLRLIVSDYLCFNWRFTCASLRFLSLLYHLRITSSPVSSPNFCSAHSQRLRSTTQAGRSLSFLSFHRTSEYPHTPLEKIKAQDQKPPDTVSHHRQYCKSML